MAQQIPPNSMVGLWVLLSSYGLSVYVPLKGFPGGAVVENLPANKRRRCRFDPWVGKIPWNRK